MVMTVQTLKEQNFENHNYSIYRLVQNFAILSTYCRRHDSFVQNSFFFFLMLSTITIIVYATN